MQYPIIQTGIILGMKSDLFQITNDNLRGMSIETLTDLRVDTVVSEINSFPFAEIQASQVT
jgi:hypothetical protein